MTQNAVSLYHVQKNTENLKVRVEGEGVEFRVRYGNLVNGTEEIFSVKGEREVYIENPREGNWFFWYNLT